MKTGGFNIERKTALIIFYTMVTVVIVFNIIGFYYIIYKERYYLDIFYIFGVVFFSLVGYFWEEITSFFGFNTKIFWFIFTLFYFLFYLGKEKVVTEIRSFFLASMFTYLVATLRGLYDFYKKGYHISSERINNMIE